MRLPLFPWILLCVIAAIGPATAGCGGSSGDDDDTVGGDGDADSDADDDLPGGAEKIFVADSLGIACGGSGDCAQAGEPAQGFDLDDHDTTDQDDPIGCGQLDGPGGLDNQLSPLMEGIVQGARLEQEPNAIILENIQSGSLLLLARMLDVDDSTRDPSVPLYFYLGNDVDEDLGNNFTGEGAFLVRDRSLEGDTLDDAKINFEDGRLAESRFDAAPSVFTLTLPLAEGLELALDIQKAQVTFQYADSGLSEGVIGGYVATDALLIALQNLDIGAIELPLPLVRTILSSQADIDAIPEGPTDQACTLDTEDEDCQPGQTCEEDVCVEPAGRCDAISLGLRFTSVPAAIEGIAEPEEIPGS